MLACLLFPSTSGACTLPFPTSEEAATRAHTSAGPEARRASRLGASCTGSSDFTPLNVPVTHVLVLEFTHGAPAPLLSVVLQESQVRSFCDGDRNGVGPPVLVWDSALLSL